MNPYKLEKVPEKEVAEQRVRYDSLLEKLGPPADDEQVEKFLADRKKGRRET